MTESAQLEVQNLPDGSVLEYDDAVHDYRIDGLKATGTSTLAKRHALLDTTFMTEKARDRGDRVHKAICLDIRGRLDIEAELSAGALVEKEVRRVEAARKARRDLGITEDRAVFAEYLTGKKAYWMATKVDVWAPFQRPIPFLNEWKSGDEEDWHRIQTALQYLMLPPCLRFCTYLDEDGGYKIKEHKDRDSIRVATAIAAANGEVLNWLRRRK